MVNDTNFVPAYDLQSTGQIERSVGVTTVLPNLQLVRVRWSLILTQK